MNLTEDEVCPQTHPDPWLRNRYAVELTVRLAGEIEEVGAILERAGYEPLDLDQWGQSYRHGEDFRQIAEVNEVEDPLGSIRLVLREEQLEAGEVEPAGARLLDLYHGVCCVYRTIPKSELYSDFVASGALEDFKSVLPEVRQALAAAAQQRYFWQPRISAPEYF